MKSIVFNLQIHQPYRLREFQVFEIASTSPIFNNSLNRDVIKELAEKSYLPTNRYFLELLKSNKNFKLNLSFSGTALEQFEEFFPEVIKSFQNIVNTGRVEILGETYYHSFSSFYSVEEFREQALMHKKKIQRIFGVTPVTFRNSEYLFNKEIIPVLKELDYKNLLLDHTSKNFSEININSIGECDDLAIIRKNESLSNHFTRDWQDNIKAKDFCKKITSEEGEEISICVPYELFAHKDNKKILSFISEFSKELEKSKIKTQTAEFICFNAVKNKIEIESQIRIAKDIKPYWFGNNLQLKALDKLYSLEKSIKELDDRELLEAWRKLQSSDHIYYMALKHLKAPHSYSHFQSPYEAFIYYMNALKHLETKADFSASV